MAIDPNKLLSSGISAGLRNLPPIGQGVNGRTGSLKTFNKPPVIPQAKLKQPSQAMLDALKQGPSIKPKVPPVPTPMIRQNEATKLASFANNKANWSNNMVTRDVTSVADTDWGQSVADLKATVAVKGDDLKTVRTKFPEFSHLNDTVVRDLMATANHYDDPMTVVSKFPELRQRNDIQLGDLYTPDKISGGSIKANIARGNDSNILDTINLPGRAMEKLDDLANKYLGPVDIEKRKKELGQRVANIPQTEVNKLREKRASSPFLRQSYKNADDYIIATRKKYTDEILGVGDKDSMQVGHIIANIPGSTARLATGIGRAVTNPVDTLTGIGKLAVNEAKAGYSAITGSEGPDSILKDRYYTNLGKTISQDPVGVASDIMGAGAGVGKTVAKAGTKLGIQSEKLAKLGDFSTKLSSASDLGIPQAVDSGIGKLTNSSNKVVKGVGNYIKYSTSPIEAMKLSKEMAKKAGSKIVGQGVADKILTNMNRLTKGEQEKFYGMTKETVGEFMNNRGITDGGEKAIAQLSEKFMASRKKADEGLSAIQGNYKNEYLSIMAKEAADFAENTLSSEAGKIRQLANKLDSEGLTMSEINAVKRFYEKNNKFTYGRDITAGEKTVRATNLDNLVRNWQMDLAEQKGFSNLRQINKETQGYKYILDKLVKNETGRLGNNAMSLTDWIVAGTGAIDPKFLSGIVVKKIYESNRFRSGMVKLINKLNNHKNKSDLILELGKIKQIQTQEDLNKYLSLPLKQNASSNSISNGNNDRLYIRNDERLIKNLPKPPTLKPKPRLIKDLPSLKKLEKKSNTTGKTISTTAGSEIFINPNTGKETNPNDIPYDRASYTASQKKDYINAVDDYNIANNRLDRVSEGRLATKNKEVQKIYNVATNMDKKSQSLYDEARKYKSADEMINGLEKNNKITYHGTDTDFNEFDISKAGLSTKAQSAKKAIFFTDNKDIARGYGEYAGERKIREIYEKVDNLQKKGKRDEASDLEAEAERLAALPYKEPIIKKTYIDSENIAEYDAGGAGFLETDKKINELIDKAIKDGKDVLIVKNLADNVYTDTSNASTHTIVLNPKVIKTEAQLRKIREEANTQKLSK